MDILSHASEESIENMGEAIKETLVDMRAKQIYNQELIYNEEEGLKTDVYARSPNRVIIIIDKVPKVEEESESDE